MTTLMTSSTQYLSLDDARLAQHARSDPQAFAELYRRHMRSIYRYHLAHTGNAGDAEDLTSQTFMAALEGMRSFRGGGPYITWLIGIASRKRALFFRGKKTQIPLDAVLHIPAPSLPTEKAAARRLQMDQLFAALKTISQDRAEAIILCFLKLYDGQREYLPSHSETGTISVLEKGALELVSAQMGRNEVLTGSIEAIGDRIRIRFVSESITDDPRMIASSRTFDLESDTLRYEMGMHTTRVERLTPHLKNSLQRVK